MRSLRDVYEINAYRAGHVCLYALFNSGRIWIKFGMNIMPLGTALKSYLSISYNR
jgi:hypothetical protein